MPMFAMTIRVWLFAVVLSTSFVGIFAATTRHNAYMVEIGKDSKEVDLKTVCPDKTSCPTNFTCCLLSNRFFYGCCDFPDATCCSDGLSCCPHDYRCDLEKKKCLPSSDKKIELSSIPTKDIIGINVVGDVICPDGMAKCSVNSTCCKVESGQYGCCPHPEGVCCKDNRHCCPKSTTCDLKTMTCVKSIGDTPEISMSEVLPAGGNFNAVICPDGGACPDGNTCCLLESGQYGCCPVPNAVCCSDHTHCCPSGYTCDNKMGSCTKGNIKIKALLKKPAKEPSTSGFPEIPNEICPSKVHTCPSGTTCCVSSTRQDLCCPLPQAVCCNDGKHCCPSGYTCDTAEGTCKRGDVEIEALLKFSPYEVLQGVEDVTCSDGTSCPTGTTCCKLQSGQYGCCPYSSAVCCSDMEHCCPSGYKCDVSQSSCIKGDIKIQAMKKFLPFEETFTPINTQASNSMCPDKLTTCPTGTTCCMIPSGKYGCCPFPDATCCNDDEHCCPSGYTCDVSEASCHKGDMIIQALKKFSPFNVLENVENVPCPDGTSCPSGTTCCKLSSGQYGCCPYSSAVCCSDMEHCCPSGYKCDVSQSSCIKGDIEIQALKKFAAVKDIQTVEDVTCHDKSKCPSGTTCCVLQTGDYGCCPYENAECCSDKAHCCPAGYKCNVAEESCIKGEIKIHTMKKFAAVKDLQKVEDVICPDHTKCFSGTTCCVLPTGEYGCCPYPNAVCCDDKLHCCPSGYKCDVSQSSCKKGDIEIQALKKFAAVKDLQKMEDIMCDGHTMCPSGNTCCKLPTGDFGCCPFPNAVCCSDGLHCCPTGFTCDVGGCTNGELKIPAMKKIAAVKDHESVKCLDGKSCPQDYSCCPLDSEKYGCCPFSKAVCCKDKIHCCPEGTSCNIVEGSCDQSGQKVVDALKMLTAKDLNIESPLKPSKSKVAVEIEKIFWSNTEYDSKQKSQTREEDFNIL